MVRNLANLSSRTYDLLVIGAGIYGISVARDAALRGLRVALVEQCDFGNATSSQHHKIIHGGLRYLQHGDLKRMRESIRERSVLLRMAPHLVYPMPFLVPTYRHRQPGKLLMAAALKLNDLVSIDRNRKLGQTKRIPCGRVLSRSECLQLCPELDQPNITGASLFVDAQVYNPDRLNLALLFSAVAAGANVTNYVQVAGFLRDGNRITGISAFDTIEGKAVSIRAKVVVNCGGPWADQIIDLLGGCKKEKPVNLTKAFLLITRPLIKNVAVGVPSRLKYSDRDALIKKGYRYLFITPWRNTSLVGTFETQYDGEPGAVSVTESEIHAAITEFNAAFPQAQLRRCDVYSVLCGLLPTGDSNDSKADVQLRKRYEVRDHTTVDGVEGLITVIGVKYTTARSVAERVVDLALIKLGKTPVRCTTSVTPVHGGSLCSVDDLLNPADNNRSAEPSAETLRHLAQTYGSEYRKLLQYCEADRFWARRVTSNLPTINAEVLHGVRMEMAQKLADIVFRRTDLGTAGYPGDESLHSCAKIMAAELGWSRNKIFEEIEQVQRSFLGAHP